MRAQLLALVLLLAPLSASARFHLWQITEIYSNANGSVQFVEAEVVNPIDNEDLTAGKILSSSSTQYNIPSNLPTTTTTHYLLFATPAFASQAGCTNVTPDFTLAGPNFMSTLGADLINFANVNSFSYTGGELPTNGTSSLNEPFNSNVRTTAVNSPTNYAGQTCQLPEPSKWLGLLLGTAFLYGLTRARRP
jgi:serralysin